MKDGSSLLKWFISYNLFKIQTPIHILDIYENLVEKQKIVSLNQRQYCVILYIFPNLATQSTLPQNATNTVPKPSVKVKTDSTYNLVNLSKIPA